MFHKLKYLKSNLVLSHNIVKLEFSPLYCEGHSERFTALYGEEKREEGVRGDPNEMRWNQ